MRELRIVAALCFAAILAPGLASASPRTVSVPATCKYPLVENSADTITLTVEAPASGTVGVATTTSISSLAWSSTGLSRLATFVDDFGTVAAGGSGVAQFRLAAGGWARSLSLGMTLGSATIPTNSTPTALAGAGSGATYGIPEAGTLPIKLATWRFNVRVNDGNGAAITLPPLAKDPSGNRVSDSDGDPSTFDVYCIPKVASADFGAIDIVSRAIPAAPVASAATSRAASAPVMCRFPYIGNYADTLAVTLDAPTSVVGGTAAVTSVRSVAWRSTGVKQLASILDGFTTLSGTGEVQVGLSSSSWSRSGSVPFTVPAMTPTYNDVNTVAGVARGSSPFTLHSPGSTLLQARGWRFNLRADDRSGAPIKLPLLTKDIDGNSISDSDGDPNTFDVYCYPGSTVPPTGEGPTHGSITVSVPPASLDARFSVQGTVALPKLAKGSAPVSGTFTGQFDSASGALGGDLALNDTQIRLVTPSANAITATIGFVPSGRLAGTYRGGLLTATQSARIKVKSVKEFGAVPIAMGNTCQTKSFSSFPLRSDASGGAFSPNTGGSLAATFSISDMNGCTGLEGIFDPNTASSGNTLKLTLVRP